MIIAPAELGQVECHEAGVDNSRFAVKTNVGVFLIKSVAAYDAVRSYIVIIQMAIGFAIALVATDVFEQLTTFCAHEASGMPSLSHRTNNASNDGVTAVRAEYSTSTVFESRWHYARARSHRFRRERGQIQDGHGAWSADWHRMR